MHGTLNHIFKNKRWFLISSLKFPNTELAVVFQSQNDTCTTTKDHKCYLRIMNESTGNFVYLTVTHLKRCPAPVVFTRQDISLPTEARRDKTKGNQAFAWYCTCASNTLHQIKKLNIQRLHLHSSVISKQTGMFGRHF